MFNHIHETVEDLGKNDIVLTPAEYQQQLLSQLLTKNKFILEIQKSTVPLAGNGLFLRGTVVHPGTVVALFPGKVHLPQYLTNDYVDSELLPDQNFFLMGRYWNFLYFIIIYNFLYI